MNKKDSQSEYLAYFNKLFQLWENTLSNNIFNNTNEISIKRATKKLSDHNIEFNKYMTDEMNKSMNKCAGGVNCMALKKHRKANYLHHNYKTSGSKNTDK